jgi:hypothetical protein
MTFCQKFFCQHTSLSNDVLSNDVRQILVRTLIYNSGPDIPLQALGDERKEF